MCGIVGWINNTNEINKEHFQSMIESLRHRGPDAEGVYISANNQIAIGHTRLAFIDLTATSNQPLCNNKKNIWITFNGEIYNYLELKQELIDSYSFNTNSDTEVLIAAYEIWGISFVKRLKGMFAIAILDERVNQLYLIRDRFGIKPLYYYISNNQLLFASELKAIIGSGVVNKTIDYSSFADFFVYRYIPSPKTIWKNIYKVEPAHYISIDITSLKYDVVEYWELIFMPNKQYSNNLIHEVGELLRKSVLEHTKADVPIGAFLSGGYDSSALVSFMKNIGESPKTFSIGFENWDKSEHSFAKLVANHLQLEHESIVADQQSISLIDAMANVYDEPIADISIIPTFMVAKLAAKSRKAVLSGEGADELFAGYTWQQDFKHKTTSTNYFSKVIAKIKTNDTVDFYAKSMAMGWFDNEELKKMLCPHLHRYIPKDSHWFYRKHYNKSLSPLKSIQYLDIKCFMAELVLTKVDRASMANSLEVRVPFLDHDLFEQIYCIDEKLMYNPNQTKHLLYENIKNDLPEIILKRKKQGFVGPDDYYMQTDFYKAELSNATLVEHNIIQRSYIDELLNNKYDWKLWKILVMEKWFNHWVAN
jgi:asparagine synthase (glutamine-hydrolysing)